MSKPPPRKKGGLLVPGRILGENVFGAEAAEPESWRRSAPDLRGKLAPDLRGKEKLS